MAGSERTIRCPHCGAENPRSLLVTVCQRCKGNLSGPARAAPPPAGPRPTQPRPAPPGPRPAKQRPPAPRRPVQPPPPALPTEYRPRPAFPEPARDHDEPVGTRPENPAVGILICLFGIVAFIIAFAIVYSLSE
jgi:uncharacterized membrane protein